MKPGDWQHTLRNLDEPEPPVYIPPRKPRPKPEPRRTKSMPAPKYMIPSEDMGEYETAGRRKSAPAKVEFQKLINLTGKVFAQIIRGRD